ncbi:MAG: hypothetical protein Q9162_006144 [Coniocarpon cinnabarinum]
MTHTLRIPYPPADIYEGPHPEWLRDLLQYLPNLQSLIVESLPSFDHVSLMAMQEPPLAPVAQVRPSLAPHLRLLNASKCHNATSGGLAVALRQFPGLVWLDLSCIAATRHETVLEALATISGLRVLKMRKVSLKDDALAALAKAIGQRATSLDLAENHLTDLSASHLLRHCFRVQQRISHLQQEHNQPLASQFDLHEQYTGGDVNSPLYELLTSGFADVLTIHDERTIGLRHLDISSNKLTLGGVSSLLASGQLKSLNAGLGQAPGAPPSSVQSAKSKAVNGVQRLIKVMKDVDQAPLQLLRISYDLVTYRPPSDLETAARPATAHEDIVFAKPEEIEELNNDFKTMPETSHTAPDTDALSTTDLQANEEPRPGPPNYETITPSSFRTATAGKALFDEGDVNAHLKGNGEDSRDSMGGRQNRGSGRLQSFDDRLAQRKSRVAFQRTRAQHFHPLLLPNLQTLILCNVPNKTSDASIAHRIIQLIQQCAKEQKLAKAEARASYACPPGADRQAFERNYVRSIFPLERLVLEIAEESPQGEASQIGAHSTSKPTSNPRADDPDVEAFWDAAQNDFSFFIDEKSAKLKQPVPTSAARNTIAEAGNLSQAEHMGASGQNEKPEYDVILEVSRFRQDRKSAEQARTASISSDENVEGFWDGVVQVQRSR